jgi:DNA-binding NarL/FixJ family response regulator
MGNNKVSKFKVPRVIIADDDNLFSQILSLTLEAAGMEVVTIVTTGREAVDATLEHKPDIVLMDIVMPEMDGLAALSVIKFNQTQIPVFILTGLADPLYLARAGELGAEGFFSKAVQSEELITAMRDVLSKKEMRVGPGKLNISSPPMFGNLIHQDDPQISSENELSEKEIEILSLIANGLDNQSILEKLHITKNTLKTHIRSIFTKLKVKDRTQAAIWALHHGYSQAETVGI